MKVLLIWEEIPEKTTLYSLEGEMADLAIEAAGYYINSEENAAVTKLNNHLIHYESLGDSQVKKAFDISGHDKVVIAGFIM